MINFPVFRFCPFCASEELEQHQQKAVKCRSCGQVYFHNVAAASAAIIETSHGVIFVRRTQEPHAGTLDLPGGFLDYGESFEEGLLREVQEETGLILTSYQYFCSFPNEYEYKRVRYFTADVVFLCRAGQSVKLQCDYEVSEILTLLPDQIDPTQVAIPSMRKAVEFYLRELSRAQSSRLLGDNDQVST